MIYAYPQEVHDFVREHCKGRRHAELAEMCNAALGTDFTKNRMRAFCNNHGYKNGLARQCRGIVKRGRDRLRQRIVGRRIAREGLRGDRRSRGKAAQSGERRRSSFEKLGLGIAWINNGIAEFSLGMVEQ